MARKRQQPAAAALPGSPSGNRTDLAIGHPTGLPYGEAGALQAAQQAVPIPAAAPPAVGPGGPGPQPPGPPGAVPGGSNAPPGGIAAMLAAAQAQAPPSGPGLNAPSMFPGEPVHAGLPSGPGPGPEVLPIGQPTAPNPLADTLAAAAQATGSTLLSSLASQAAAEGAAQ